jgi:hypothetical protein
MALYCQLEYCHLLLSASASFCNYQSFLFWLSGNDSENLLIHTNTALFGLTPTNTALFGLTIMVLPGDMPPPPDTSVTSPVVKTYVSQQHAFQIRAKKTVATTSTECKLCSVCFASKAQYQEHTALRSHTVREAYRTNR